MKQHSEIRSLVRKTLQEQADPGYKIFNDKIAVPGYPSFGVRTPQMRALAKEVAKGPDWEAYCCDMEQAFAQGEEPFFEEVLVWATVIGYAKMPFEQRTYHLDRMVPFIKDWATCDVCISSYKFIAKDKEAMWDYLQKWVVSSREFEARFAFVCFLGHYVDEEYLEQVFELCERFDRDQYYVQMAIAWLVSVYYIKFPVLTEPFIESNKMSKWTHNKGIQKIRESRRVSDEDKERLNKLKRK